MALCSLVCGIPSLLQRLVLQKKVLLHRRDLGPGGRAPEPRSTPPPAGAPEPRRKTTSQELPGALRPSARAGEGPLDTETWDPWQPSVCSPPPGPTGWRLHLLGAGCLHCILRAVSSLSRWAADCWGTVLDL
ncbi:hypothetical protein QTO34_014044 [Cnephaeus nilssonii]|uniref:Uncharacterized protein n=1 Tax=Cnephaeus nilssonii TaxID=3371016 RepID=A0AA40I975_CNENI|nr:hypothetical protein QTO34_014044 [Eptesicus nilssonii]